jgi:hypothetical protein
VRDFFGLTPDADGFVSIPAERHHLRSVAKGRDLKGDEFVIVITGEQGAVPSYLALSVDEARALFNHLLRVLQEPPAGLW